MPKYVLHYFPGNGRATCARAILCYVKADWVNHLIDREKEWPILKKSDLCEYELVPVLEVDGEKLSQSNAINIYLAETYGLMGNNPKENYYINNLLMTYEDILQKGQALWKCSDESKKPELKKELEDILKLYYKRFEERYLKLGKGKYYLGEKFTLADIYLTGIYWLFIDGFKIQFPLSDVCPNLGELMKRIKENELKEYFEKYFVYL